MATQTNLPFSWDEVDKHSDLGRLGLVLDALPDTDIIRALGAMRKNGRNEYPVSAMWTSCPLSSKIYIHIADSFFLKRPPLLLNFSIRQLQPESAF